MSDDKPPSRMGDMPAPSPRATQRGTIPPPPPRMGTPPSVPAVRDMERGTPVPIDLERFVQRLLAAAYPLGKPAQFVRELLIEGIKAKIPQIVATRTGALVGSNLLKILSEPDGP